MTVNQPKWTFKKEAEREYLEDGKPYGALAKKYKVSRSTKIQVINKLKKVPDKLV